MIRTASFFLLGLVVYPLCAHNHIHEHRTPLTYAFRIGTDNNGTILYLCKARLFNSIQPGKTWAGYRFCNVPYGGKEYVLDQFTIPHQREFMAYNWERNINGAVVVGRDTNGQSLFLCQSNFNGSIQPGKTWAGYNHCNISYRGREIITNDYRVLAPTQEIIVHAHPEIHVHSSQRNTHYHY